MTPYYANWQNHYQGHEQVLAEMMAEGITHFLCLSQVIIDEVDQEVILSLSHDLKRPVLSLDGIAISLSEGRWTFNTDHYLSDYVSKVQSDHISSFLTGFMLLTDAEELPESDLSFLNGHWVCDEASTKNLLESVYASKEDLSTDLEANKMLSMVVNWPTIVLGGFKNHEFRCTDSHVVENRIIMKVKHHELPGIQEWTFFYHKGCLLDIQGKMFLKKLSTTRGIDSENSGGHKRLRENR